MVAIAFVAQGRPSFEEQVAPALEAGGLTPQMVRFDENLLTLYRQGEFTPPIYAAASDNPLRMPFFAQNVAQEVTNQAGKTHEIVSLGARWAGVGSRRTLLGSPIAAAAEAAAKPGAFDAAVKKMLSASGATSAASSVAEGAVPKEVEQAAALILETMLQSRLWRQGSFSNVQNPAREFQNWVSTEAAPEPDSANRAFALYRNFEPKLMVAGGHDLLFAVQEASKLVASVPATAKFERTVSTPWGEIRLSGGVDNRYGENKGTRAEPPLMLVIDTGGSDVYVNTPGNHSFDNWASVVIDTSGKDRYVSDAALENTALMQWTGRKDGGNVCGPGGALFGYAILFDLQGDDLYRSHRAGVGSGRMGVAVVHDAAGNDQYEGYSNGVGYGEFGVGIVEDVVGDDSYGGLYQVQGVGQTRGFGALIDRAGKDRYIAEDKVIDAPSAQSAEHNVNMSQGVGNGSRRDYLDGRSLAGGFGMLWDGGGDDHYSGGVFCQGVGYWMAVGMLWDVSGNDKYEGVWYSQGASAHFAVGYLEDVSGNDTYIATMNMAQGAGHDFGPGYLIDRAGNDNYKAPNLSLGGGNAAGMGFFLDEAGDDVYDSAGTTLGKVSDIPPPGTMRSRAIALGVFADLGGNDTYPAAATWAKNGSKAVNTGGKGPSLQESQTGVFWDR
jgi:hypothetical protein